MFMEIMHVSQPTSYEIGVIPGSILHTVNEIYIYLPDLQGTSVEQSTYYREPFMFS
jgi:hypothetical protein